MKYYIIITFALILIGCHDFRHSPLVKHGGVPGVLSDVSVENLPGQARISYTLPDDEDLLYVLAVYKTNRGEEKSVKSSLFNNFILISGFADTLPVSVDLYSVNKSEVKSSPISVVVKPLTSPLESVYKSLNIQPDFGGVNISYNNELGNQYVFYTLIKDSLGKWVLYDRRTSQPQAFSYSVRGLDSVNTDFGVYITDSWSNSSDTMKVTAKPLYEEQVDNSLWTLGDLPSDYSDPKYTTSKVNHLWDNDIHERVSTYCYFYENPVTASALPTWFTIDLGRAYKLSRVRVYQYEGRGAYMYSDGNPKSYEFWGSNSLVDDWGSWTLLQHCESIKPSGLPLGSRSADDVAYAIKGEDFNFPIDAPPVRYIRFKLLATWGHINYLLLDEISFWGQKQ